MSRNNVVMNNGVLLVAICEIVTSLEHPPSVPSMRSLISWIELAGLSLHQHDAESRIHENRCRSPRHDVDNSHHEDIALLT